jgi:NAD(P)-dependent dehydrogenase (short-subunit alcohol dehydrogenase family)
MNAPLPGQKKIAFVTGGNRGIGFETVRGLAQQGVHVILGSRDERAGKAAADRLRQADLPVDALAFDVNRAEDHHAAAQYFESRFGHLDILVNNAGIMIDGESRASTVPVGLLRQTFETNFFAPIALTQALLPLLRKSEAGRVVNLSSILASLGLHSKPGSPIYDSKIFAYDASKTALNTFTVHLAHELKDTAIKVNSAHPGWVKSDMGGEEAPMELVDGAKTSIALALLPASGPTGGFYHLGEPLPW